MINRKCIVCGKVFKTQECWIKKRKLGGQFCSRKCSDIFKIGKPNGRKGEKRPSTTGCKNPNWKGGKYKHIKGYVYAYAPNHPYKIAHNYILEHRLVIEQQIGRYLLPTEEVHHLGKKDDNKPNMLMAFVNHSVHKAFERNDMVNPTEIIFDGRKLH